METTCQSSYPLKSENARPFGTCTVYLSCAEMALPPKTPRHANVVVVNMTAEPARKPREDEKNFLNTSLSLWVAKNWDIMGLSIRHQIIEQSSINDNTVR